MVALALTGCTEERGAVRPPQPSAAVLTGDDLLAHDVAIRLAARLSGEVTSAAYVVGTYRQWQGNPGRRGLPTTSQIKPTDKVLVVKVFGSFISNHSRLAGSTPSLDGEAMLVYNATRRAGVMSGFGGAPVPARRAAVDDPQLVALGSPRAITMPAHVGATSTP